MTDLTVHTDPPVSEAQRRAMYAAAEGKSTLGIPEEVGKEFVKADDEKKIKSAGIAYMSTDGRICLLKRGDKGDHPGEWAFPGGHLEDDEAPDHAAIREFDEETGHNVPRIVPIGQFGKFCAYGATGPEFEIRESPESAGHVWAKLDELPTPMHPRCLEIIQSEAFVNMGITELDIARGMSTGLMSSPQHYGNVWLFDIRITGTGVAYRSAHEEFTFRKPEDYLNDEFVARCNGLPVIWEHPKSAVLNSKEFSDRMVGTVLLPYIKGSEVWGIAKIYDDGAIELMRSEKLSTSPCVVTKGDAEATLDDGQKILIEGKPSVLDHIAICDVGVWDKGGEPAGVNSQNQAGASMMNEDEKAKADAEATEMKAKMDAMQAKLDEYEAKEAERAAKKADKKAKKDAMKADKAKKDEMPTEMMADKAKKDEDEKRHEIAKLDSVSDKIKELESRIPTALTDADMNALADAQAKADSAFSAFGEAAPKPISGETPLAYRRRIADKLKAHSKTYKDVDLAKVDGALFDITEGAIYADAVMAASSPSVRAAGNLRPRKTTTIAGHTVIEYTGDPSAAMRDFEARPARLRSINTNLH